MTANESINPPFYDQLFTGYLGMVMIQGEVRTIYPADLMGEVNPATLMPRDQEPVHLQEYKVKGEELPPVLQALGINSVSSWTSSAVELKKDANAAAVLVVEISQKGVKKQIEFSRHAGKITATAQASHTGSPESMLRSPGPEVLSDEEREEIFMKVYFGEGEDFLKSDGAVGEWARSLQLGMMPIRPDVDDIELLRTVLTELHKP